MAASIGVRFSRALIMVRGTNGVAAAVNFYQNGLGMAVIRHTDQWAELVCPVGGSSSSNSTANNKSTNHHSMQFQLSIQAVESSEASLCVGYSPFLNFDIDDMDSVVARCVQLGANLDGPIQYPAHGKVAALRAPDGHMIGLYEPTM
jgi:catechol 2,3-dioxygenase-like lactoylglutathione lyase family enzyme